MKHIKKKSQKKPTKKKRIREEDKREITEMTLINGPWNDPRETNTLRVGNLKIREINKSGSYYCWMPKDLALMAPKEMIIKFKKPITIEDLGSKDIKEGNIAAHLWSKVYPVEKRKKNVTSQHQKIETLALMKMLGIDKRAEDVIMFGVLKAKLQDVGARWYKHDVNWCDKNNKLFSEEGCLEHFLEHKHTEGRLKEAGLTKEEIDDTEMIEAVMKKIIDEQLPEIDQLYPSEDIENTVKEFQRLLKEKSEENEKEIYRDKHGNIIPESRIVPEEEIRAWRMFRKQQKIENEEIAEAAEKLKKEREEKREK